jgi:hypothetical protein
MAVTGLPANTTGVAVITIARAAAVTPANAHAAARPELRPALAASKVPPMSGNPTMRGRAIVGSIMRRLCAALGS